MRIDIISAVPQLLESPLNHSIIKRAKEKAFLDKVHILSTKHYKTTHQNLSSRHFVTFFV